MKKRNSAQVRAAHVKDVTLTAMKLAACVAGAGVAVGAMVVFMWLCDSLGVMM